MFSTAVIFGALFLLCALFVQSPAVEKPFLIRLIHFSLALNVANLFLCLYLSVVILPSPRRAFQAAACYNFAYHSLHSDVNR